MGYMAPPLAELTAQAQTLTSAGDLAGARDVLADVLRTADADPRRATADLAVAAALHARVLIALGDPESARLWAAFAHSAEERLHGARDERTIAAAAMHAAVLQRIGQHGRASSVYHDLVGELAALEGPDSPRVLAAEADLATAEHAAGHCSTARSRLARAWRRHSRVHGDAAPAGIKMLARLGAMERECGLATESAEHLALASELCARYLAADHPLARQSAALVAGTSSGRHTCGRRDTTGGRPFRPFPRRPTVTDPAGGRPAAFPAHAPGQPPPDDRPTDPNGTVYPGLDASRPGVGKPWPGPTDSRPSTAAPGPGTTGSHPGATASRPGTTDSRPGTTASRPGTTDSRPGTTASRPGTTAPGPGTTASGSHAATTRPGPADAGPDAAHARPSTADTRPGTAGLPPGAAIPRPRAAPSYPGTEPDPRAARPSPGAGGPFPREAEPRPGTAEYPHRTADPRRGTADPWPYPADSRPAESPAHAAESGSYTAESRPRATETRPGTAGSRPHATETRPAESRPAESRPAESRPADSGPHATETRPAETRPHATGTRPAETRPHVAGSSSRTAGSPSHAADPYPGSVDPDGLDDEMPPDNRPTDPNGTVYQQPLYLSDVHRLPGDPTGRHARADTPPPLPGNRAPDYGEDGRPLPVGTARASTLTDPPNSRRLPSSTRRSRAGHPLLLATVLAGGVAAAAAVVILTLPGADGATTPEPPATTATGAQALTATSEPGSPQNVRLRDEGPSVSLQWEYPRDARGEVLITVARSDRPPVTVAELPAGATDYVVYSLSERYDYCITVAVRGEEQEIAAAAPVCTKR
ncbi:hypothetical protein SAMN05421541_105360 [Actinoplanes philippinensis]|uniref:Fibronectin type-III domain-containing protein n=2 Tax=Actinoplanes philippinensis TaxID=35752 RepID=A0A1I2FGF9_9ACTN|nr:hypothetical protein SAMN05421541_105360 [Actinoplanes philippinensis]